MFTFITIADVHFNAIPAEKMYRQLDEAVLKYVKDHKVDAIFFAGDLFDNIISLNSRSSHLLMEFMTVLIDIARESGVKYIRIIKGTSSHDNNQLVNLRVFQNTTKVDFKIFETVTTEELDGQKILYLPEEYMTRVDEYYKDYLYEGAMYDIIIGHGMFKETSFQASKQESAITLSKAPVFDSSKMISLCRGPIVFGHIHTRCTIKKRISYVGSFSRWVFGEEEPKGFSVTAYDNGEFTHEFIENKLAERYDTVTAVDVDKYRVDPKSLVATFDKLIVDKLRIKIVVEGDKDFSYMLSFIREYYSKNKDVRLDIVDKSVAMRDARVEQKTEELMEKYGFVFDKTLSDADIISTFIKVKRNKDISPDYIREELGIT